ncbi:MAG: hypothetical protein AAF438_17665, partial [Pseudomonadota bacterium]
MLEAPLAIWAAKATHVEPRSAGRRWLALFGGLRLQAQFCSYRMAMRIERRTRKLASWSLSIDAHRQARRLDHGAISRPNGLQHVQYLALGA